MVALGSDTPPSLTISDWASQELSLIFVNRVHHGTIMSNPPRQLQELIRSALEVETAEDSAKAGPPGWGMERPAVWATQSDPLTSSAGSPRVLAGPFPARLQPVLSLCYYLLEIPLNCEPKPMPMVARNHVYWFEQQA